MPKLIFETAVHRDPETGDLQSYWPERWPIETLFEELFESGSPFFARSYMNDPSALQGNSLKVAWIHYYLPEDLITARANANITKGFRYVGFDPTNGGKNTDPDFFASACTEVINNRGFLLDYHFDRKPVDVQAQIVEDWSDQWEPDRIYAEDTAEQGHVWTAFTSQINGGRGTKYPFEIKKPQGSRNPGGKAIRLQAMGARFQNAQILVPGVIVDGQLVAHPKWNSFVNQWRSFPSGHDDILDAVYWSTEDAFADVQAAAAASSSMRVASPDELGESREEYAEHGPVVVPKTDRRGRPEVPIGRPHRTRQSYRDYMTH